MTYSRRFIIGSIAAFSFAFVVLPSIPQVRRLLSRPLVVTNPAAQGDACYVLCGGGAMWERLDAAADLIQTGRVKHVMLMRDDARSQYSFKSGSSWTRSQWMADYLAWRGVPAGKIVWVPQAGGLLGTSAEAKAVAAILPRDVGTLVVVSSAPHMRRCLLAFRRSLASRTAVVPYAATSFEDSFEMHHPIWLEYLKLLVYYALS